MKSRQSHKSTYKSSGKNNAKQKIEDKDDTEILETLLQRKAHYKKLFEQLVQMGLPVVVREISNQNFITILKKQPKSIRMIQKYISIKLEGSPKIYHKVKLAVICGKYLTTVLNKSQVLEVEQLIGLIHESVEIQELRQIARVKQLNTQVGKEFDYIKFLELINVPYTNLQLQYSKFGATDLNGVYQVKNIHILQEYGSIDLFEGVRKLRLQVHQMIAAIANILDSMDTKDIDQIEDAFLAYIELKNSLQFQFISPVQEKEIQLELDNDDDRYSTKSDISEKSNKSVQFLTRRSESVPKSILKNSKLKDNQQSQISVIKEELRSSQEGKSSSKGEIKKEKNKYRIKKRKSQYNYSNNQDNSEGFNLFKQNQFEQIFYRSQTVNLLDITQTIPNKTFFLSIKQKKLKQQGKRSVLYDVFDSCRMYDSKVMECKLVNPKLPFKKYPFLNYEQDSEEEIAEDVESEARSLEGSPTSSMQEFIEIDYKLTNNNSQGELTIIIQDSFNFDQLLPFKAIMLSENIPILQSVKKQYQSKNLQSLVVSLNSKMNSKSEFDQIKVNAGQLNISESDFQIVPIVEGIADQ